MELGQAAIGLGRPKSGLYTGPTHLFRLGPSLPNCTGRAGLAHNSKVAGSDQAWPGNGSSDKKSIVQCNVRDKKPVYLCSLLPERLETCALNLEFDEDDGEVTFSVLGPQSVHLSGFFYGEAEDEGHPCDDCDSDDSYEEGVMVTDSEDESVYDSEDEDEGDDYIDDEFGMYPPSPVPNSGGHLFMVRAFMAIDFNLALNFKWNIAKCPLRIEEIVDDEKPTNENGGSKRAKKKKNQSSTSEDKENSNGQIVVKAGSGVPILESEDEDGFPISARDKPDKSNTGAKLEETNDERIGEETQKKNKKDVAREKKLKRKIDAVGQDGEPARENIDSSVQPETIIPENEAKKKKNKKKKVAEKVESAQESVMPKSNGAEHPPVAEIENDLKPSSEKKKEKKKKKLQEITATPNTEEKPTDKKGSVIEKQDKLDAKSLQVRTFPNGLVIEELVMGKPNGQRASPGKKVTVRYIGKLKKNGKIFDSNIGKAPFKFRLGIGQVIKGWDVGVNGMRVGDKRRLTIPPAMGYGAKGCGPDIPGNSWLVFDVELIDVN
ncbi:hypothetical protein BUALT_Bualt06G0124800 [Buddleja alternifolia]|uniref:peptidylprolyl isomerase n=1 Tax=Buddleja alternifolia TaxID=168488 RepID=A0AAV6XLM9_9LAMI|nr:hypothetical protein BUALT_Bualt06G0124800 [Buddleja alternifolia]